MTPEQEITLIAQQLLKTCCDYYATGVWDKIKREVIEDVIETTDDNGFTTGDVALAIGQALLLNLS